MKQFRFRVGNKELLLVCLLLILPGCDGGIFGTGDGQSSTTDNAGSPSDPSGPDPDSPDDSTVTTPPGSEPDASETDSQLEPVAFENLQIGSTNPQPLVSLLNLSDVALNASTFPSSEALFSAAIQPGTISSQTEVALETTALSVMNVATTEPVLLLSPLNLGAFSVTTLIARNRLATNATETESDDSLTSVEVIAIHSQKLPSDDGVARVRLLQISMLDDNDQTASMSLVPADSQPGGSEIGLGTLSAASFGQQVDYQLAAPGSYRLVDSLDRLTPSVVELAAGEFYTLILKGEPAELEILQDSQSEDQSAADAHLQQPR